MGLPISVIANESRKLPYLSNELDIYVDHVSGFLVWFPPNLCGMYGSLSNFTETVSRFNTYDVYRVAVLNFEPIWVVKQAKINSNASIQQ